MRNLHLHTSTFNSSPRPWSENPKYRKKLLHKSQTPCRRRHWFPWGKTHRSGWRVDQHPEHPAKNKDQRLQKHHLQVLPPHKKLHQQLQGPSPWRKILQFPDHPKEHSPATPASTAAWTHPPRPSPVSTLQRQSKWARWHPTAQGRLLRPLHRGRPRCLKSQKSHRDCLKSPRATKHTSTKTLDEAQSRPECRRPSKQTEAPKSSHQDPTDGTAPLALIVFVPQEEPGHQHSVCASKQPMKRLRDLPWHLQVIQEDRTGAAQYPWEVNQVKYLFSP